MKRRFRGTHFGFGLALLGAAHFPSLAVPATSYTISAGATTTIDEYGVCREVTNNHVLRSLWVPTKTVSEWSSFVASPGVASLAACVSLPPQNQVAPFIADSDDPCTPTTYTVPAGVTKLLVQLWGAGGGASGGYTQGYLDVTPGENLTLIVGEKGKSNGTSGSCGGGGPVAGPSPGMSGGGRSAIHRGSTELMTAGGGGGSGGGYWGGQGGIGGGTTAGSGPVSGTCGHGGQGGTQSAGGAGGTGSSYMNGTAGSAFQGGTGGSHSCTGGCRGGGGGGGYFGGGGGAAGATSCAIGGGGGGGSSYCGGAGVSDCTAYLGFGASPYQNGRAVVTPVLDAPVRTVFNTTGADQSYTVPAGVTTLLVQLWGGGAMGSTHTSLSDWGANGGYTQAYLTVTPGETLTIIAGGPGNNVPAAAAYGGGGASPRGNGGAGRSAIRRGSTELLTAGGAGGTAAGYIDRGAVGGGIGGVGKECDLSSGVKAQPGGAGGAAGECKDKNGTAGTSYQGGTGGYGSLVATSNGGGGGGGGYVGGGGGGGRTGPGGGDRSGSGAGGSGYCHSVGVTHCATLDGYGAHGGSYVPGLQGGARDVHALASGGRVIITPFP